MSVYSWCEQQAKQIKRRSIPRYRDSMSSMALAVWRDSDSGRLEDRSGLLDRTQSSISRLTKRGFMRPERRQPELGSQCPPRSWQSGSRTTEHRILAGVLGEDGAKDGLEGLDDTWPLRHDERRNDLDGIADAVEEALGL
jgi:hypothetical protein